MRVFLFRPRFAPPIAAGTKLQTIRERARCEPGDAMSLRVWSDRAYRSPQREIVPPVVCAAVRPVWIGVVRRSPRLMVAVDGERIVADQVDDFARRDGFRDADEMAAYYRAQKVDDFEGFVHEWRQGDQR